MEIPEGITHRVFGMPQSRIQYYKHESLKWYFWSDIKQSWVRSVRSSTWLENNLIEVVL